MTICPNCNKQLADGVKFCNACGTPITETVFCRNCGAKISADAAFCKNCGAATVKNEPEVVNYSAQAAVENVNPIQDEKAVEPQPQVVPIAKPKRKVSKKLVAVCCSIVAVIVAATIILLTLFGGGVNNYGLYIKNNQMYYIDISGDEPLQITTELYEGAIENNDMVNVGNVLGRYTHLTKDGKKLFFVDKINQTSLSLYYRNLDNKKESAIKIDSDVLSYSVSEDGNLVTYIKGFGGENTLYQHNLVTKEKIASEVTTFVVSNDGEKIGYLDKNGGMYLKYSGKDKEKLDRDVTNVLHINDDFDTVYYLKEHDLYKKTEGEEKVKIDSKISSVICVYDSGEIYYVKEGTKEVLMTDYIDDDKKAEDAALYKDSLPEYPNYSDYENYNDYWDACDKYEEAYDNWYDKEARDELREELNGKKATVNIKELYFYNGESKKLLTDSYNSHSGAANESPIIIFASYTLDTKSKVKLSEISYVSQVEELIQNAFNTSSGDKQIAIKDKVSKFEQNNAVSFEISKDGKTVYYLDDYSGEKSVGDLYKVEISDDKLGKRELYEKEVYYSITLTEDGKILYYKDVDKYKGTLYIDKKKVDDDVSTYVNYFEDDEMLVYIVDYNSEKHYGTLKCYTDGKAVKIKDDVYNYTVTPGGEIMYLYDYSTSSYEGDLYIYDGGESEKIDSDVMVLIPVYESKYRGQHELVGEQY